MSSNSFAADTSPRPYEQGNVAQQSAVPLKDMPTHVLAPATLRALLMSQFPSPLQGNKPKLSQKPRVVSNASEVALEAMRITRESMQKGALAELRPNGALPMVSPSRTINQSSGGTSGTRLNKFVRRLHDMLQAEKDNGIIEWRRGLLVLHSTADFAKTILPKYFNTRNFKTFRRQLNYYGFVHVRSFSTAAASTTALWVNQELAELGSAEISSVLTLKRVEPCELQKTAEGRRQRKEMALHTVEEDLKIDSKTLQLEQIQYLARREFALHAPAAVPAARVDTKHLQSVPLEITFPNGRLDAHLQQPQCLNQVQSQDAENIVSDDTQSRSSESSSVEHPEEAVEDSMGAATLLLLLSRAG